ncbi:double zinc ribbon domain-containing protein [Roseibium salinum]
MRCLSCDRRVGTEDGLCPVCWQKMQFIESPGATGWAYPSPMM